MKKVLFVLIALLVVIQFFRIDKTNPKVVAADDFIEITKPTEDVEALLRSTCYDCHSNETKYPWYSNVAPVSWWMKHHIDEGREELNFSEWGTYSEKRIDHKLEECAEEVEEKHMPLPSYTWTHSDAKLTHDQIELLEAFFNGLRTKQ